MILNVKSLCGLKIYSLDEGERREEVCAFTYDPKSLNLKALLVKKAGNVNDLFIVMYDRVITFGINTVIIESSDQLINPKNVKEDIGELLKDVDVYFDSMTGRLEMTKNSRFFSQISKHK